MTMDPTAFTALIDQVNALRADATDRAPGTVDPGFARILGLVEGEDRVSLQQVIDLVNACGFSIVRTQQPPALNRSQRRARQRR